MGWHMWTIPETKQCITYPAFNHKALVTKACMRWECVDWWVFVTTVHVMGPELGSRAELVSTHMRVRVRMYIYVYIKMPQRKAGVFSCWEWESEGGLALWSMVASLMMMWPSPTIFWRSIPHDSFLAVLVLIVELWRALGCPWNSCVSTSFVCGR